ncbi:kinase-like domain-containing protein [Bombardia bombarda]|uniref:Kinase-like domain-containing protein n=1 Tax=Bombardia bombarda TaxID=252184 RepID=A0AA39TGC1_9PEZI|nr:kinase-like domain-containing protein [Bombardia bombarda]
MSSPPNNPSPNPSIVVHLVKPTGSSDGLNSALELPTSVGTAKTYTPPDDENETDGLPIITDTDLDLARLLRIHKVPIASSGSGTDGGFWPLKLLHRILSRDRVQRELRIHYKEHTNDELQRLLNKIRPIHNPKQGSVEDNTHCIRIFALLTLCDKAEDIESFINNGHSDDILPVTKQCTCRRPNSVCSCGVCKQNDRQLTEIDRSTREGGFAFVSRVKIHPSSHGFRDVLQENIDRVYLQIKLSHEVFALKTLREENTRNHEEDFRRELAQLKRFNGLVHNHLVTLLATYNFRGKYCFLFPCANCDLDEFWESTEPKFDTETVRWVAKQMAGIMAAIHIIHDPKHLHDKLNPQEKRYGRHGDIKPDNILWFNLGEDKSDRGSLVISDMGLTSFNRDSSRSYIPNKNVLGAPGYRPPECDIEGGTVSRLFDIWTLGCLFLEMLTWLLGGQKLRNEFRKERMTVKYITGHVSDVFFEILKMNKATTEVNVAKVKDAVTKWFITLHQHPLCTRFIHDALDIIEKKMIIVMSADLKRATSAELEIEFKRLYEDLTDADFTDPDPQIRQYESTVGVEAKLKSIAQQTIEESGTQILPYIGSKPRSSMTDYDKLDDRTEKGAHWTRPGGLIE